MTTSLFKSIHNVILEHIDKYATLISKEHGIEKENLLRLWKQIELNPPTLSVEKIVDPHPPLPKKNVSVYVQFCNKHRPLLKEKCPSMSFGDISKELGKMWRSLSQQEKDTYQSSSPSPTPVKIEQQEDHSKLSVSALKQMCEDFNLKKNGNKSILLARLKEYKLQQKPIPPPQTTIDDDELVFFENESAKVSDISSNSSASSFAIDDDVDDLDLDDTTD
jgi:hypothetical protein